VVIGLPTAPCPEWEPQACLGTNLTYQIGDGIVMF